MKRKAIDMSNLTDENNPIKRIINSSMEEIETIIAIMYMTKQAVALPAILNIMKLGDDAGLFDALFKFGTLTVLFEYDGGRWHNADRLNRDTSKSLKAIKNDENCFVIRLRQESAAKMDVEDPRLHILNFKTFNRRKCAIEFLDAVKKICETMKSEVPDIETEADMDEAVIQEAKLYVNKAARMAYEKIYDYSEDDVIRECLLNTKGVITRVNNEVWFKKMDEFRTFMKSDQQFIVSFNGCIPKYLEDDTWWVGIHKLAELAGHEKLHTLLTKSLCKRLGVVGFVDALDKLAEKVGWDRIPTLVNDCLCKRIEAPGFVDALDKLAEKVGWDRMPALVNNCLCKRLEAPGFVDALGKLAEKVGWDRMPTLVNDCLCKRLEAPGFVDALGKLAEKVGWDRMPTLVDGCLCKRLEAPGFVDALGKLAEKVGWDRMPTLVDGCLCKRLEAPDFVDALGKLAEKVGWDRMPTLVNNCLCKRLEAPDFVDALGKLAEKVGWDRMPTLVNDCLCKRIESPGFVDALDKLSVIIGGWEYIPSYCQAQVSSRITSEKYLNSVNDLFQLGKSLGISSDKLRAVLGGKNPFVPTIISANTWFMNQSADVQLARFRDMTGIYKVRTAKLRDYGWEVSRPM